MVVSLDLDVLLLNGVRPALFQLEEVLVREHHIEVQIKQRRILLIDLPLSL